MGHLPTPVFLVIFLYFPVKHMKISQCEVRFPVSVQDIAALYEILKGAKNPADLLMVSIRWMEQGAQAMDFP